MILLPDTGHPHPEAGCPEGSVGDGGTQDVACSVQDKVLESAVTVYAWTFSAGRGPVGSAKHEIGPGLGIHWNKESKSHSPFGYSEIIIHHSGCRLSRRVKSFPVFRELSRPRMTFGKPTRPFTGTPGTHYVNCFKTEARSGGLIVLFVQACAS